MWLAQNIFSQGYSTNSKGHKTWDFCILDDALAMIGECHSLQMDLALPGSQVGVTETNAMLKSCYKTSDFQLKHIHSLFRPSGANTAL